MLGMLSTATPASAPRSSRGVPQHWGGGHSQGEAPGVGGRGAQGCRDEAHLNAQTLLELLAGGKERLGGGEFQVPELVLHPRGGGGGTAWWWNWDQNGIWVLNWGDKWDLGGGIGEKNGICWDLSLKLGIKWDLVGFGLWNLGENGISWDLDCGIGIKTGFGS